MVVIFYVEVAWKNRILGRQRNHIGLFLNFAAFLLVKIFWTFSLRPLGGEKIE